MSGTVFAAIGGGGIAGAVGGGGAARWREAVRALGVAFPYAISNAIFGGLVEPLALGWKKSGVEHYFYIYLAAVMVLGVIGAVMIHETKHKSMILED